MDDPERFEALYRDWWRVVCEAAEEVLGSRMDAEDAAQRVFMRMWRSGGWREIQQPSPFFRKAGRNEALSMGRRRSEPTVRFDEELSTGLRDRGVGPDERVAQEQFRRLVGERIGQLPPRCGAVCALVFIQGLTHRETADALAITIRAVEKQVERGRDHLGSWRLQGYP